MWTSKPLLYSWHTPTLIIDGMHIKCEDKLLGGKKGICILWIGRCFLNRTYGSKKARKIWDKDFIILYIYVYIWQRTHT